MKTHIQVRWVYPRHVPPGWRARGALSGGGDRARVGEAVCSRASLSVHPSCRHRCSRSHRPGATALPPTAAHVCWITLPGWQWLLVCRRSGPTAGQVDRPLHRGALACPLACLLMLACLCLSCPQTPLTVNSSFYVRRHRSTRTRGSSWCRRGRRQQRRRAQRRRRLRRAQAQAR